MDDQQNAMVVFAEELGEVALELLDMQKQVFKAIRFGIDEQRDLPTSNRERIESEWQDLLGSMLHLETHGINLMPNSAAIENKINKIEKYAEYSKSLGTIRQQLAKPAVENMQLLPIYATREMRNAGNDKLRALNADKTRSLDDRANAIYNAMVTAYNAKAQDTAG
ncbi:MAG: hypothetical protein V4605_03370 [Pseudomonadota bacterium]